MKLQSTNFKDEEDFPELDYMVCYLVNVDVWVHHVHEIQRELVSLPGIP